MAGKHPLYNEVVDVSREYLGPTGERFIRRQIEVHLKTRPEEIKPNDLPELISWSKLAFAMLTDDQKHVESFSNDLEALSKGNKINTRYGKAA